MLNQCQFIGNLGRDPEVRTFQNGGKVCNLRLAVTEKWTKDGERQERTEWISVAVFAEPLVRLAENYLRKGSKVFISGKLETRKWQDQTGNDRYSTEVVLRPYSGVIQMLDAPGGKQERPASPGEMVGVGHTGGGSQGGGLDLDDEVPFSPEWRA